MSDIKNFITFSLIVGSIILISCVSAQIIFNLNNQNNITLQELEPNYTVGRCVMWNMTYNNSQYIVNEVITDLDLNRCIYLDDEDISCNLFKFEEDYVDITIKNKTCIDDWAHGKLNSSEIDQCYLQEAEGHCISKMITVDGW